MAWQVSGGVAVLTLACALARCSGGSTAVDTAEQTYEISEPVRTVALDARTASVDVRTGGGPVTVTEILRYSHTKPNVSHRLDGTTLRLQETGCGEGVRLRCDTDYRIRVPSRTSVRITTKAGSVTVRGLAGPLNVTTDAGAINGQQLTADRATVATNAGSAKLQFVEPPTQVVATSDLGAIDIRVPGDQAYAVDVSTDLATSDVSVTRDAGSAFRISVETKVGAVRVAPN